MVRHFVQILIAWKGFLWGHLGELRCYFASSFSPLRRALLHISVEAPHQQLCQGGRLFLQPQFTSTMAKNQGCEKRRGAGKGRQCAVAAEPFLCTCGQCSYAHACMSSCVAPPFPTPSTQGDVKMDSASWQRCCCSVDNQDIKYNYSKRETACSERSN